MGTFSSVISYQGIHNRQKIIRIIIKEDHSSLINKREVIEIVRHHMMKTEIKLRSVNELFVKIQHVLGHKSDTWKID